MADFCTNIQDQGNKLFGLQSCSSEITNNLNKQFSRDHQTSNMDDDILPLDTDSGCGSATYIKMSTGDDSSEKMDVSIVNKCTDSTHLSAKPSLSSAFMISSLLSTSASSSSVSQAGCNSLSKQVISNDIELDTSRQLSISESSSLVQNVQTAYSLDSSRNFIVNNGLDDSEGNSLELTEEHLTPCESADRQDPKGLDAGTTEKQRDNSSDVSIQDGEDGCVVRTSPVILLNENCESVLKVDSEGLVPENESVTSVKVQTKMAVHGMTVSSQRSVLDNKSDVSYDMPDKLQGEHLTNEDIFLDENTNVGNVNSKVENVTSNNVAVVNSTESVGDASLVRSVSVCDSVRGLDENGIDNHMSEIESESERLKYHTSYENVDVEMCNLHSLETADIQSSSQLNSKTGENIPAAGLDSAQAELSVLENTSSSLDTQCEPDFHSFAASERFISQAGENETANSTSMTSDSNNTEDVAHNKTADISELNVSTLCDKKIDEKCNELSEELTSGAKVNTETPQETAVHSDRHKSSINEISGGKKHLIQAENSNIETDKLKKESVSLPEFTDERIVIDDDDILIVDGAVKTEPDTSSSAQKYTFKNILQKPKDVASPSIKDTTLTGEQKCEKSSERIRNALNETSILEDKVIDKQNEAKVMVNHSLDSNSHTSMGSGESLQNIESASERKRFQSGENFSAAKRSRLDSMPEKEQKMVKESGSKTADNGVVLTEKSVAVAEDKDLTHSKDNKTIPLSNEVLQSLIALRVRAFIKNQKQVNMDRLSLRTKGMQSASNLWKETAKHLEKSVLELTALNQKLESRKAHLIAVKRLASRSIGIQAGEENVTSSPSAIQSSPVNAAAQRNPPPYTASPMQSTPKRPGRPPLSQRSVPSMPPSAVTPQHENVPQPPPGRIISSQPQSNSVNLIDLTDDEEIAKNTVPKPATQTPPQPVNHVLNRAAVGPKMSTPANGYIQKTPLPHGTTSQGQISQPTHSSSSGSQAVNSLNSTVGASRSHYQSFTINNSTVHHTGNAVVPGSKSTPVNSTYVPAGQPSTSANSRAVPNSTSAAPSAVTASAKTSALSLPPSFLISNKHPAPLPSNMDTGNAPPTAKKRPPKPSLKISRVSQGIVLSWNMPSLADVEKIATYQLYAYQESDSATPRSSLWKKVGEVTALPLPMACTLTQFQDGNKYHFAVRAVDQYGRCGSYSDPSSIYLGPKV